MAETLLAWYLLMGTVILCIGVFHSSFEPAINASFNQAVRKFGNRITPIILISIALVLFVVTWPACLFWGAIKERD